MTKKNLINYFNKNIWTPFINIGKGYTVVEMLVVIVVIGVMASIALPNYQAAIEKQKSQEGLNVLRNVYGAQKRYIMSNGIKAINFSQLDMTMGNVGNGGGNGGGGGNNGGSLYSTISTGNIAIGNTGVGNIQINGHDVMGTYFRTGSNPYVLSILDNGDIYCTCGGSTTGCNNICSKIKTWK